MCGLVAADDSKGWEHEGMDLFIARRLVASRAPFDTLTALLSALYHYFQFNLPSCIAHIKPFVYQFSFSPNDITLTA